jgi:hypothetical protein
MRQLGDIEQGALSTPTFVAASAHASTTSLSRRKGEAKYGAFAPSPQFRAASSYEVCIGTVFAQ